jgi:hypothetical protein
MSFQITILKVLAGHPEGRASLADLKRAMAILISSGSDWTDRMKRLAARAPDLDIFSQSFVLRDNAGWQITMPAERFSAVEACAIVGPIGFHGLNMATGSALVLRVWRTREKFRSREHIRRCLLDAPDPA